MANRKEDEKNERIIRGLLKLPENRRCINCNSLGPQYVCINFWTFVCTNCSGIHREFTHRVKSVSMAKFTSQEVSALQGGGNERAREVYFKEWDPQRHSIPDSSNIMKLRDFIKHVYVDRRYSGERITDKPPRVKMGDKEESYENRRVDTYRGGSRSPPYEDQRHNERSGPGGRSEDKIYRYNYDDKRSPGHEREIRPGEFRKSPVRFEVVDDRRRDDRFGNGRRFEERRFSDGESKFGGISPNRQNDSDISVPPLVRPVREILGEGVPPLRVGDPPKANGGKAMEVTTHRQRTASSSSLGSVDGSSIELKRANSASLIDFNADPEPPPATTVLPAQLVSTTVQSDTPSTVPSVDDQNWANFDFSPQPVAPAPAPTPTPTPTPAPVPPKVNTLESLLFELSTPAPAAPAPAPTHGPAPPPPPPPAPVGSTDLFLTSTAAPTTPAGNMPILRTGGGAPTLAINNTSTLPVIGSAAAAPVGNVSPMPVGSNVSAAAPGGMLTLPASGGDSSTKVHDGSQWPSMQQHQSSLFSATDGQSSAPQFVPTDQASNNQSTQGPFGGQPSQAASVSTQEASSGVTSQSTSSEAKHSGRKELPEDLFTLSYATAPAPVRGWHPGPSPGMGFGLQYPTAAAMTNFPHSSKSANPFDLNNEPTLVHAPSLPSMTSLQGALPPVATHQNLLRSTSLNTPSPRWIPPQSPSYASSVQSPSYTSNIQSPSYTSNIQSPSYSSAFPPGAYMGQQVPGNMPTSGHQGSGEAFGGDASFYGNLATDHQYGRFSQPDTLNSFSSGGGNPFG